MLDVVEMVLLPLRDSSAHMDLVDTWQEAESKAASGSIASSCYGSQASSEVVGCWEERRSQVCLREGSFELVECMRVSHPTPDSGSNRNLLLLILPRFKFPIQSPDSKSRFWAPVHGPVVQHCFGNCIGHWTSFFSFTNHNKLQQRSRSSKHRSIEPLQVARQRWARGHLIRAHHVL